MYLCIFSGAVISSVSESALRSLKSKLAFSCLPGIILSFPVQNALSQILTRHGPAPVLIAACCLCLAPRSLESSWVVRCCGGEGSSIPVRLAALLLGDIFDKEKTKS